MRSLRVIVADDEDTSRLLAETILRKAGHQVTACADGAELVRRCLAPDASFDLVLVDMLMPGMDGLTAVRALRAHPSTTTVPIVVLSASVAGSSIQEALAAGCDRHMGKPYKRQDLLALIDALLPEG